LVAYLLSGGSPNAFIVFGGGCLMLGLVLSGRRPRASRGNGTAALLLALAVATAALAVAASGAGTARAGIVPHFCYSSMSNWFGASSTSPKWCEPVYYPPGKGCSTLEVHHTGRNSFGVVDYKFHLYVSWCRHRQANGHYVWDSLNFHTAFTNLGS